MRTDLIRDLYNKGYTISEIALIVNVTESYVVHYLERIKVLRK